MERKACALAFHAGFYSEFKNRYRIFQMNSYYVYIMASRTRTIYVGVTADLTRRVNEHKTSLSPSFTSRYHVTKLVYFEETNDVTEALLREKQIKGWDRAKKITLIETENPSWKDLSENW